VHKFPITINKDAINYYKLIIDIGSFIFPLTKEANTLVTGCVVDEK
jgi:hypothetical protein